MRQPSVAKVRKLCARCGKVFFVYPSVSAQRFCSRVCANEVKREKGGSRWLNCPVCDCRFLVYRAVYKRAKSRGRQLWCSVECYLKSKVWRNFPNLSEKELLKLVKPFGFKYVGDRTFFVGKKCPDFVNRKRKLVVELFGEYWHSRNEVPRRKRHFQKHGFRCLVVWQRELKNHARVVARLKSFLYT